MAGSRAHTIGTLPWILLWWFKTAGDFFLLVEILFFGVLLDYFDHHPIRRLKRLLRGNTDDLPGQINWLHTWLALGVITCVYLFYFALTFRFETILPMFAYWTHLILVDGPGDYRAGHVPHDIHRLFPGFVCYETQTPLVMKFIGGLGKRWRLFREKKIVLLSVKTCVAFSLVAVIVGIMLCVFALEPTWPYKGIAFSAGLLWIVAGWLIFFLVIQEYRLDKKIQRRKW